MFVMPALRLPACGSPLRIDCIKDAGWYLGRLVGKLSVYCPRSRPSPGWQGWTGWMSARL